MKRNYLLLICILLSLIVFYSCKKNESVKDGLSADPEQVKEGTLNEEPIPFPTSFASNETPFNIKVLPDEFPSIYTYQMDDPKTGEMLFKNYQWISDNWEEVELKWSEAITKAKMNGLAWPLKGRDGFDYLLKFTQPNSNRKGKNNKVKSEVTQNDFKFQLYRVESNGTLTDVIDSSNLKIDDKEDAPIFSELLVLEDNTVLVKYDSGKLLRYDLGTKKKLNEYENVVPDFTVQKTNLLCMNTNKDKLLIIDIPTGDLLREIALNIPEMENSTKFCLDEDEVIYIATTSGIYRLETDEPTLLFSAEKATIFGLNDKKDVLIEGISKVEENIFVYYTVHKNDSDFQSPYDKDNNKIYKYSAN